MKLDTLQELSPEKLIVERVQVIESLGTVKHHLPAMLTFLEDERFLPTLLDNPDIAAVVTTTALAKKLPGNYGVLIAENPRSAFFRLHNTLAEKTDFYWKPFPTEIAPDAQIHLHAYVAPRNVRIGAGTIIEPGVNILEKTIIGEHVIIRSGCTIGSQGFEFKRLGEEILPVAHAGGVKIGDRVELQANCAVSRSIFGGFTEIGSDSKLDNLIHVAHNVHIGKRCMIAASAMLAGSVVMGNDVWIGPGASISSEVSIGDGASITIGAVVTKDVLPGQRVSGHFAIDHEKFVSFIKSIR